MSEDKIRTDEDFIYSPKYENSLSRFLADNDSGVDIERAARCLKMAASEVDKIYKEALQKLRSMIE